MAEWKPQINYNYYNSSYYSYAFDFMCQNEPEQNTDNPNSSNEVMDLSNFNPGIAPDYSSAPSTSREQHAGSSHNRGPGVIYFGDTQSGSLLHAAPQQVRSGAEDDVRRTESESASDSEAHVSPDSWSSRESSLSHEALTTWVKQVNEASNRSPDSSNQVSSSVMVEPECFAATGNESPVSQVSPTAQVRSGPSSTTGKVRTGFTHGQMNALAHRFTVQKYLTPPEMRELAGVIGLSYKQVKTWFQNRRMKLRRYEKDNRHRERAIRNAQIHGAMYSNNNNIPPNMPPYQGEAQPQLRAHYNHRMMEPPLRKPAAQTGNFYLAAMGNAPGTSGYAPWTFNTSQSAMPTRPQMAAWPMPLSVGHYEYNRSAFNTAPVNNAVNDTSFKSQNEEPVDTGIVHSGSQ